ncbi:HpcH/HpaI aldolase/citrate lyase family protein [Streptomyces albidus (ex Kaewkla and Franco 2022)]|uniref:HpcH/HpaI aldolase/citrate lyase family protein n=1 Tax=Streptomyces albidus (ex Kaewkla and Franco 2022) TaxID=722709 RepID=UPI0015EF9CE4|nr:CoA ester lyase [Streptomyces albidus (ex Kaewkla and Franco 2022)]
MDVGRALLFVPGDRPDRIAKALATSADAVAVDFEDAVGDAEKASARAATADAFSGLPDAPRPAVYVRINDLDTSEAEEDLAAVASMLTATRLAGLIVPKAESSKEIGLLQGVLTTAERAARIEPGSLALIPIIETARGVLEAAATAAASPRVRTLLFGTLDLAGELGVEPTVEGRELLHARSQVVLAARAAGLAGPLDGPYPALDDEAGLIRSSTAARELGYTGRVVLHPAQVGPVQRLFAPTDSELVRAREVLAAYEEAQKQGVGALRLPDGTFVDRPVVNRAAALVEEAALHAGDRAEAAR